MAISVLGGTAGIGKTALAVWWAHRVADDFPDGQLCINLRGFGPKGLLVTPEEAIRGFLDAFEITPQRIPEGLDAQAALYRSLLADKRVLIVLDNARDAEHVRGLLPGSPGSLVIVTSRKDLSSLVAKEGAQPLTLDLLAPDEAKHLLTLRLGSTRLAAEPEAVRQLINLSAGLPLALAIVAARAATHPTFPLTVFAEQLSDVHSRLNSLTAGDAASDVRAVLSWSYEALSHNAARLFRWLGVHPGPDISTLAAASLVGVSLRTSQLVLNEIAQAHMIIEDPPGRYAFHDLLRAYATELAHACESESERKLALQRVIDHYLHAAYDADLVLQPHQEAHIALGEPEHGVIVASFDDATQAMSWFVAEHPVLLAMIERAMDARFDAQTWQLASTLATFLHRRGHWGDWVASHHTALKAAVRSNNPLGQAVIHRGLGYAHAELGSLDHAYTHLTVALNLFGGLDDHEGQAHIYHGLGGIRERQGRHQEALEYAQKALELFQAGDHQAGQATALNAIGWCHTLLREHHLAIMACQQALTLQQQIGNRDGEAVAWDSLGYAYHQLGQHDQAIRCYERSNSLFHDLGDRFYEATVLDHLGDSHQALGHHDEAHDSWQRAVAILNELDHPAADGLRAKMFDGD
jgi:tetratricopeptide (TPR) repeat protein